jgi:hypothetical protein
MATTSDTDMTMPAEVSGPQRAASGECGCLGGRTATFELVLQLDGGREGDGVRPKRFGPTVLAGSGQLGRFPSASGSLTRAQWPPEVSVHSDP